ncbi:LORF2 protein, partial [Crocuta crocuta]
KKINKNNKPLETMIRKKGKAKTMNIRNERGIIAIDAIDIKKLIREYYEQRCANKSNNLGEMDKFLGKCKLPKLTQENIDYLNSPAPCPVCIKELEFGVKNLPTKEAPGPDDFTCEIYQTFKEKRIQLNTNIFRKLEQRELANSVNEASITLMPKSDK